MELFKDKIKEMLLQNECSGDTDLIYKFSDADGLRTGRSGYSYGISQFDIENNWDAILTLMDCGFRPKDLKRLYLQQGDISDLNNILEASADYIDEADNRHINDMIKHCDIYNEIEGAALAMIIDYHNQLRFDIGGRLYCYIQDVHKFGGDITPAIIHWFKLNHTKWGQDRKDDVERRYKNTLVVFCG